jgi:hypothetical protein
MQALPDNVDVLGRLRYDAALYAPKPRRTKRRGRPRLHGRRLAWPDNRVARRADRWITVTLPNGRACEVQTWTALWWKVCRERPVRAVASRRPGGGEVEFFYTTDLSLSPGEVLSAYGERWSIECLFHEVKERMGFEDPQCRTERAVERTAAFLLWTAGVVHYWFLARSEPSLIGWRPRWWSKHRRPEAAPSFSEMLAAMRREILTAGLFQRSAPRGHLNKTLYTLIESIAHAA